MKNTLQNTRNGKGGASGLPWDGSAICPEGNLNGLNLPPKVPKRALAGQDVIRSLLGAKRGYGGTPVPVGEVTMAWLHGHASKPMV